MVESIMSAIISLDETVQLVEDEDGILVTDLESENSEHNDHSLINHNSDWVSVFGNGKSFNCVSLLYSIRFFYFCRDLARNLWMNLRKYQ